MPRPPPRSEAEIRGWPLARSSGAAIAGRAGRVRSLGVFKDHAAFATSVRSRYATALFEQLVDRQVHEIAAAALNVEHDFLTGGEHALHRFQIQTFASHGWRALVFAQRRHEA